MLKVLVGYPKKEEEKEIMERMTGTEILSAKPVISGPELLHAREIINQIYIDPKIKDYILEIVFASRAPAEYNLKDLEGLISWGASPRASIYLNLASRAHAFLRHRGYVTPEDVKGIAPDVLRHRILLSYEAEAEEIVSDDVIKQILEKIEVP
jgi:MoxR-like ATPase